MRIPENLRYAEDHEWILVEDDIITIGITDYAQDALGDIVFVELPFEDDELEKGDAFGVIESVKAASDIYLPAGGTVVEVNHELEDSPELVNENPYDAWIVKLKIADPAELEDLLSAEEYEKHCEEE